MGFIYFCPPQARKNCKYSLDINRKTRIPNTNCNQVYGTFNLIYYNSIRSRSWDHRLQNLVNVSCIIILRPRWNRTMLFTYWIFTQWSVIVWSIFINNNVLGAEIVFQLSSEAMVLFQNWFKAQRPFCFTPVPSRDILRPVTSQYRCYPGYWIIA